MPPQESRQYQLHIATNAHPAPKHGACLPRFELGHHYRCLSKLLVDHHLTQIEALPYPHTYMQTNNFDNNDRKMQLDQLWLQQCTVLAGVRLPYHYNKLSTYLEQCNHLLYQNLLQVGLLSSITTINQYIQFVHTLTYVCWMF